MTTRLARKSVRVRTTIGAVAALSTLVAISALALQAFVASEIRSGLDATLEAQASDRVALLETGADPQGLTTALGHEAIVIILGSDGTVLGSSGTPTPAEGLSLPLGFSTASLNAFESNARSESAEISVDDVSVDDVAVGHPEQLRVVVLESQSGQRVVVGEEGETQSATIARVRLVLGIGSLGVAIAAGMIAWLVTGRALRPVQQIRRDLAAIISSEPGQRIGLPGTHDEIEGLAQSMNEVLHRLQYQTVLRKRFVSDASHELKSPIANAKILIETTPVDATTVELQQVHQTLQRELDRLASLVDDLLFLAKGDEGALRTDALPVNLDDVIFDEAERLGIRSNVLIHAGLVEPLQVCGDVAQLTRAIRNLLENAERHATSMVKVSIEHGGGTARVVVEDDGHGVAVADRDTIFERFTRSSADRARVEPSVHAGPEGTGLGLSIVADIAVGHDGNVWVEDRGTEPGARFVLELPH